MQSFLNERRIERQEPLAAHTKKRATLGENQGFDNCSMGPCSGTGINQISKLSCKVDNIILRAVLLWLNKGVGRQDCLGSCG